MLIAGIGGGVVAVAVIIVLVLKCKSGKSASHDSFDTPEKKNNDKNQSETTGSKNALMGFKQKMTREELLQKEQEEMQ